MVSDILRARVVLIMGETIYWEYLFASVGEDAKTTPACATSVGLDFSSNTFTGAQVMPFNLVSCTASCGLNVRNSHCDCPPVPTHTLSLSE